MISRDTPDERSLLTAFILDQQTLQRSTWHFSKLAAHLNSTECRSSFSDFVQVRRRSPEAHWRKRQSKTVSVIGIVIFTKCLDWISSAILIRHKDGALPTAESKSQESWCALSPHSPPTPARGPWTICSLFTVSHLSHLVEKIWAETKQSHAWRWLSFKGSVHLLLDCFLSAMSPKIGIQ